MRNILQRVAGTVLKPSVLRCLQFLTYFHTCFVFDIHTIVNINIVVCRAVSRQRLGKHVPAATDTRATIKGLLETVVSTRPVQRGYKEDS
jgi:hypothetical protein